MTELIVRRWLIAIVLIVCAAIPASASWITFVNCANLANGIFTPQYRFEAAEPVCFYGGEYPANQTRIYLENNLTKKIRYIDVVSHDGMVSSLDGYYFTDLEQGNFRLPGACSEQFVCTNQNGDNFCRSSDTSCELVRFTGGASGCSLDAGYVDTDADNDNWSDGCDPIKNDPTEWFDTDLDGVGKNNDMNDFNSGIVTLINPDNNNTGGDAQNETTNTTQPDGGGGGGGGSSGGGGGGYNPVFPSKNCTPEYECDFWGDCVDGKQLRSCILVNNCTAAGNLPQLEQDCAMPAGASDNQAQVLPGESAGSATNLTGPANPGADGTPNLITGQLISNIPGGYTGLGVGLLILIAVVAGAVVIRLKLKRKPKRSG